MFIPAKADAAAVVLRKVRRVRGGTGVEDGFEFMAGSV
jgi:hypothetical protein